MPVLTRGDSQMIVVPATYSPMAVARSFKVVDASELSGRILLVIYDRQTPHAAIIETDIGTLNSVPRHRVLAVLDLQRKPYLDSDILTVERCWEEASVFQIKGICINPSERDRGLATRPYGALVLRCGVTLISDFEQYDGGRILWQKVARESEYISVFILDTERNAFWLYDGSKVVYDGGCIPEERIWSMSPDTKCHGVVLVAKEKQRVYRLMEPRVPYRV